MINITHKKRYETTKKTYQEKTKTIEFIEQDNDYATVVETKYNSALVLYEDNIIEVTLSNNIKGICSKILYPGDKVIISNQEIIGIIKRTNILSRDKYDSTKKDGIGIQKIIATNIDLAVIVVSANEPPLHPKFIDRYMIILQNSNIPFIICINKSDLISNKEEHILDIYRKLNIPIIKTSTYTKEGIQKLKELLLDKQSILVGHSGVGKSSLTKEIMSNEEIRVGNLREKNKRGCHTTTSSTYYRWNDTSSIIDTPGIRSLDISNFNAEDIKDYFIEFKKYNNTCKYNNCLHYDEPITSCNIKQQVETKNISKERYESYYKIISEIKKK